MNTITLKTISTFVEHLRHNTLVKPEIWTADFDNHSIRAFDSRIVIKYDCKVGKYRLFIDGCLVTINNSINMMLADIYKYVYQTNHVVDLDSKILKYIDSYEQYYKDYIAKQPVDYDLLTSNNTVCNEQPDKQSNIETTEAPRAESKSKFESANTSCVDKTTCISNESGSTFDSGIKYSEKVKKSKESKEFSKTTKTTKTNEPDEIRVKQPDDLAKQQFQRIITNCYGELRKLSNGFTDWSFLGINNPDDLVRRYLCGFRG